MGKLWLQTASVNTLAARFDVSGGRIASFSIEQTASEQYPTLRPHAFEIAFGTETTDAWRSTSSGRRSTGRTQIADAIGLAEPDLVFPNHGDHAYAKVELDERSVDYVRSRLQSVDDELLRQLLWASLWEMVRDPAPSPEYLAIGAAQLPTEYDLDILEIVLERVAMALVRYVPEAIACRVAQVVRVTCRCSLSARPGRADPWARSAIASRVDAGDVERLVAASATGKPSAASSSTRRCAGRSSSRVRRSTSTERHAACARRRREFV